MKKAKSYNMVTKKIIYDDLECEIWWMSQFGWKVSRCDEDKEVERFAGYKEGLFSDTKYLINVMQYEVAFVRNTDMPQHEELFKLYDSYYAAKEHHAKCAWREEKSSAPLFCLLFLGYLVYAFFYGVMHFDLLKGVTETFVPFLVIAAVAVVLVLLRNKARKKKTQDAEQAIADILAKANKMSGVAPFEKSKELIDHLLARYDYVKQYM